MVHLRLSHDCLQEIKGARAFTHFWAYIKIIIEKKISPIFLSNKEDIVWKIENKLIFYYDLIKTGFKFQPKRILEQYQSPALKSPSIEAGLFINFPAGEDILTGLRAKQTVSPQKLTHEGHFLTHFFSVKRVFPTISFLIKALLTQTQLFTLIDRWGFDPDPRKQKSRKGCASLIFSEWTRLAITCSLLTIQQIQCVLPATDSHLVIFNTRHIQPEGTNYSSVFNMPQCLQRTVLEK